eukprot:TRINITY_DN9696_c0_g1_i1.p1 TRINITY_DN9696_c0_g1~~TRINITY_DN9696_c0_g1_i1.p1  ORF type:complete len:1325 (+),score=299.28 TRINITY_DN9696_c0_g1_i1:269-4243(+)
MDGLNKKQQAAQSKKEKEAQKKKEKEDKKRQKEEAKRLKKEQKNQPKAGAGAGSSVPPPSSLNNAPLFKTQLSSSSIPTVGNNNGTNNHHFSGTNGTATPPHTPTGSIGSIGRTTSFTGAAHSSGTVCTNAGRTHNNGTSPHTSSGGVSLPTSGSGINPGGGTGGANAAGAGKGQTGTGLLAVGKVAGRRPRKFKEKEFNSLLESLSAGLATSKKLDLSHKHLDKYAAGALAAVLERNTTITELNLSENEIGDDGIVPISRMLEKNKAIKSLDLTFNKLSDKGIKHISACLNNNVFITELYLEERQVDMNDVIGVQVTLEPISDAELTKIEKLLELNKKFELLLTGGSNNLELPGRNQSFVNVNIIERFQRLELIDLRHNKLKTLPPQIAKLKYLKMLILSDNRISELPHQLSECYRLELLDLNRNMLTELPLSLTNLPNLKMLQIENNKFQDLPRFALGAMQSLQSLDIKGNPLNALSCFSARFKNLMDKGGKDVLAFLRANNDGFEYIYRMKLMFVGNGNVGKTTLLKNFTGDKICTGEEPNVATDGIDIRTWSVKHPGKGHLSSEATINDEQLSSRFINFSCWDFAGQEVYYATHSFFLSDRAIYLVVFNLLLPEETNQIEYWLQSINSRIEDAPIFMVGTHADDRRCTVEYVTHYFNTLKEKYRNRFRILNYFAISNIEKDKEKSATNLPELKDKILREALKQSYMPDHMPLSYLALEEKLLGCKTNKPPVLPWVQFARLALDCRIREDGIRTATQVLNDFGSLVWFSDEALNDVVVVDPQWITATFATVVSLKSSFIRDGLLKLSDLPHVWTAPDYPPELHDKLLLMLEKLEVISRFKHEGEDKILIPCLLPDSPPRQDELEKQWPTFTAGGQAGRIYNFEFLPLGFFSRLLVRFLLSQYIPVIYWKTGIVLKREEESVKLTLTKDSRNKAFPVVMELWVRGENPGRHLTPLVDNIDTLVEDWLRVKFEVTVPCLHCIREGAEPFQFSLKEVEKSVSEGLTEVKCRGITSVNISEIAPDVAMSEYKGHRVRYNDCKIIKQIGEGGFAKVYKALWNTEIIALKELTLDSNATADSLGFEFEDAEDPLEIFAEFRKEVSMMSVMQHPNIVALKGLCMAPFCMLLEFCSKGSLYDYIHETTNPLNWAIIFKLAEDIAKGMNFMHTFTPPLIHRDLKSPNILLAVEEDPQTKKGIIVAKVADFGLSRSLMLAGKLTKKVVDNPVWLAPEMMRKEDYDNKVDVYAFGVIMWELVSREDFLGNVTFLSAIEDAVLKGERSPIPDIAQKDYPEYASTVFSNRHMHTVHVCLTFTCLHRVDYHVLGR